MNHIPRRTFLSFAGLALLLGKPSRLLSRKPKVFDLLKCGTIVTLKRPLVAGYMTKDGFNPITKEPVA